MEERWFLVIFKNICRVSFFNRTFLFGQKHQIIGFELQAVKLRTRSHIFFGNGHFFSKKGTFLKKYLTWNRNTHIKTFKFWWKISYFLVEKNNNSIKNSIGWEEKVKNIRTNPYCTLPLPGFTPGIRNTYLLNLAL